MSSKEYPTDTMSCSEDEASVASCDRAETDAGVPEPFSPYRPSYRPFTQMVGKRGYIKRRYDPETYFDLNEVPDDEYIYWERLSLLDDGEGRWVENSNKKNKEFKKKTIGCVIGKLRLPKNQRELSVEVATRQDARKYNSYGGLEALALAGACCVVNWYRERYDSFEYEDRVENDEEFRTLVERLDVDIVGARKKLKKEINESGGLPELLAFISHRLW